MLFRDINIPSAIYLDNDLRMNNDREIATIILNLFNNFGMEAFELRAIFIHWYNLYFIL